MSFHLDTVISAATASYNYLMAYEFKTYADSFFITVQNVILVGLLWGYEKKKGSLVNKIVIAVLGVLLGVLFLSIPSPDKDFVGKLSFFRAYPQVRSWLRQIDLRQILNLVTTPLIIVSRGSQIWTNFVNKSTGSLSLTTNALQFLGASARIFTVMSGNGGDGALITSNAIAAALSGIIVIQIVSNADAKTATAGKSSVKKAKKQ